MDIGDYMQLKKGMEFELQTFDLEDVERLSEPIFEACLSYVNSHLTSKELEKFYNVNGVMAQKILEILMENDVIKRNQAGDKYYINVQ